MRDLSFIWPRRVTFIFFQHHTVLRLCTYSTHSRWLIWAKLFIFPRHQHPVDNAGFFSFMTLQWLSPLAWRAHKASSLRMEDVWGLSCHEASEMNYQRWALLICFFFIGTAKLIYSWVLFVKYVRAKSKSGFLFAEFNGEQMEASKTTWVTVQ